MRYHQINEARERYHGVIEPNSRPRYGQEITLKTGVKAYHATHEQVGKILSNREVKTYDSMGTWLTSNQAMAAMMYGPNVEAYLIPAGRYLLARRNQDLWDMVLNCLPIIEKTIGKEAADHLARYPLNGANLQWMRDVRETIKREFREVGKVKDAVQDHEVYQAFRWRSPGTVQRYKELVKSFEWYRMVCTNPTYNQEYRAMLERVGYQGIIFNGRHWDNSPEKQTIFIVFHKEDLHPILR